VRAGAAWTWNALLLPSHSGRDARSNEVSPLLEHGNEFEMARFRIVQRVG
jgi:hypothetical protein